MSILGQLIFTGISGLELVKEEREFLEKEAIGGVILFSHNYDNPFQLAELVSSLQALRKDHPLFVAVDHEGGRVVRFKSDFTKPPAMYHLAKTQSPEMVYQMAQIMAKELSACGINLNFSPVCDVWTNQKNQVIGDRALGSDSETVSLYASSIVNGLQNNGVLACAKHFPGHGCTVEDSHYHLPVVEKSLDELRELEFRPFAKAIAAQVTFVMTAHIIVSGIDRELPCSLCPEIYQILRKDLQFKKLIITDDMQMKAITDHYGVGEAALMAIKAGADIVEYRNMEFARQALEELKRAIGGGRGHKNLSNRLVSQKVARIKELKSAHLASLPPVSPLKAKSLVGAAENQIFAREVQEKIARA